MILGIILVVLAVIVLGVAVAALLQKLPGNNVIGIRVPEVRRDPEMWNLAHRVAAPSWIVASIAGAAGGIIALNASGWGWGWVAVALIAGLALIGVGSAMGAHTVAVVDAQRQAESEAEGCGCGEGGCGDAGCGDAGHSGAVCTDASCADASYAASHSTDGTVANSAAASCCSDSSSPTSSAAACGTHDPAADCGVAGGCGACALNGACEGGGVRFDNPASTAGLAPAVDMDAARRAAEAIDR